MSDAAVTVIVTGVVQVVIIAGGLLTLWVKLKYGIDTAQGAAVKAEESATKAAQKVEVVEEKLDANTSTTESVSQKTDTIVDQTNGVLTYMGNLIANIANRVDKLEDYNHIASHRVLDAINAMHLKLAAMSVSQEKPSPLNPSTGGKQ